MAKPDAYDPFDNIEDARGSSNSKFIQPGNYLLEIRSARRGKTRKQKPFVAVDATVLMSDNADFKPGSVACWMLMLDDPESPALGNFRKWCALASTVKMGEEVSIDAIKKPEVLEICGENNPMRGVRLRASAWNIETKKGADFTVVEWSGPLAGDEKVTVALSAPAARAAATGDEREPGDDDEPF